MIYKVNFLDTSKFLSLPETGMGYQIFDAAINGSITKRRYLVYNADLILDFDNTFAESKKQVFSIQNKTLLSEVKTLNLDIKNVLQGLILVALLRVVSLSMPQFFTTVLLQYPLTYGVMFIPIYNIVKN